MLPDAEVTVVSGSMPAGTNGPAADATTRIPEHDREADAVAAVASFDEVEPVPAYAAPAPVPPAPSPEAPKKKGHGALIIGIVALIAVLAVGAALYVRVNGLPGAPSGAYTADSPAQVSAKTHVRPKDANGKEMSAYVAYLISTKGSGDAASIATTPYRYEGTDDFGFTLADFGDVEDGDYTLVIVDTSDSNSSARYDTPIHYEHDNPKAPETIDPAPPTPSTNGSQAATTTTDTRTDEQKAADLYLAKCREYIDQYGEPGVASYQGGDLACGLAVVRLIDFNGDGMDELLLVYDAVPAPSNEHDAFSEDQQKAYKAEVWAYKDGQISKVYDEGDTVNASNGASMFLTLCSLDGENCMRTWKTENATGVGTSSENDTIAYHTFDGSAFSPVLTLAAHYKNPYSSDLSVSYEVDGVAASESDYDDAAARVEETETVWLLSFKGSRSVADSAKETISDSNATLDELKSRSAGNAATTAAATSEQAYTSESVDKNYTIKTGEQSNSTCGVMWSYPQFSKIDGSTGDALDALNSQFVQSCEEQAKTSAGWQFPTAEAIPDGELVLNYQDLCASIAGSVASVYSVRYATGGGAHGYDASFGTFYDLSTGKAVDAATALNMSADDLAAKGVAGINAYLAKNPSDLGVSSDDISRMASEQDRYVRDEKGTFIITRSYELGSYAFGSHRIYVMANNPAGNSIVGTEVADNY